jgi:hypothetical protein
MHEPGGAPKPRNPRPRILASIGAAGAVLSLGVLAPTSWAVFTTGLIGAIVMIHLVAVRQPVAPSALPMGDIDAELFRILADARLGHIRSVEKNPERRTRRTL